MLHFPVSLMNRLNKTESVIFDPCMISFLLKDLIFRMFLSADSIFIPRHKNVAVYIENILPVKKS